MRQRFVLVLAISIAPAVCRADAKWTPDDVVNMESASGFQLSPDGKHVVWVKRVADVEKDAHVAHLVRTDLDARRDVRLTRGPDSCLAPHWSPDGKHIAFLSARPAPKKPADKARRRAAEEKEEATTQIWLMDAFGGEPWPLTEGKRDVKAFDWAGPGHLVFAAQEAPTLRENTLADEKKDKSVVVEDEAHEPPVRLFRVSLDGKKVVRLTDNADRVAQLAVSPDGRHAVTTHDRSLRFTYDNRVKPIVYLTDLESGERKQIFKNAALNIGAVRWTPDGKGFFAANEHCGKPEFAQASVTELYHHDLASGKETKIDLAWDNGLTAQVENGSAPGFVPVADGFLALLASGVRNKAARYTREGDGWKRVWLDGEHIGNLVGLEATADGKRVVYAHSTASRPTRWHVASLDGAKLVKPAPLPPMNEHLKDLKFARTEVVRWKGAGGEEVEGILHYPHDYEKGQKRPLVVLIHGGPASLDMDSWDESWAYSANLLCQRGAFVLKPNYHGSSNYGLKWLESITDGKYCEAEVEDIEKGVDALIARGLADPDKLGIGGWSNGGILTNIIITRTTRYKAAVTGAGNSEWVTDWANCSFGDAFDRYYLGKSPLEDAERYIKKSPFYKLDKVRTPTLIFFGSEDRVVPTSQGWATYRGLQQLGKTDVRFVLFPGEEHSLKNLSHQTRKIEEEMAWFDKYLFGTKQPDLAGLKADSPLAWALKRKGAKRQDGRYGVAEGGKLLPEVVKHEGHWVGRFEVTRAQFAEFEKTFKVEAGKENHPATGVAYEQARAYCGWLTKQTGTKYRLPTEEEGEDLYGKPTAGENTLDHWAGYAVNPEDAGRLREKLKELEGSAPLLREVGSFRGVGEENLVYDLGGNAAEWVQGKDGKGKVRGGSADSPADNRQATTPATAEYRGFRVVREEKDAARR